MIVNQIVRSSQIFGVPVVVVSGEVDLTNAGNLRDALVDERAEPVLIISLQDVRYIDSSGLSALIAEHKVRQERGKRLLVVLPRPPVSRIFEVTQLDRVLVCFQELADAIQEARSNGAEMFEPSMDITS